MIVGKDWNLVADYGFASPAAEEPENAGSAKRNSGDFHRLGSTGELPQQLIAAAERTGPR